METEVSDMALQAKVFSQFKIERSNSHEKYAMILVCIPVISCRYATEHESRPVRTLW